MSDKEEVKSFIKKRDSLRKQADAYDVLIESLQGGEGKSNRRRGKKRHNMSKAARKKISLAQKARHAAARAAKAAK
jgi:hypothetical protein